MFHGSLVALVTPMHPDGSIDYSTLTKLVDWHVNNYSDGLVILGTTGESATIEITERQRIIHHVVEQVGDCLPVIVGTGTNSTAHTIKLTQQAMEAGADAALIVTPYYNKPTQEGLFAHFSAIAKAVPIPQVLYNVPSRTGCDLLPTTVLRLNQYSNIVGLKEATGEIERLKQLAEANLDLLSGDDATALSFILSGGRGVISVVANVAPKMVHKMCKLASEGDQQQALQYDRLLQGLYKALFCESNPIPVKWALQEMGMIEAGIRLPLTPLSEYFHQQVRMALEQANCLQTQVKT